MAGLLCGPMGASAQSRDEKGPQPTLQDAGDRIREDSSRDRSVPAGGRLRLFLDDTLLSPTLATRVAFSAALDHRGREPFEWGRGADGYGKRLVARTGLTLTQSGVQHATAALLRVDPRGDRVRCGCSHPLRRTAHALAGAVVTRDARGRAVPNVPLFAGAYGGALLATAWYPSSYTARPDAMRLATMTIVAQAGVNVFREFAPDLKRLARRARSRR